VDGVDFGGHLVGVQLLLEDFEWVEVLHRIMWGIDLNILKIGELWHVRCGKGFFNLGEMGGNGGNIRIVLKGYGFSIWLKPLAMVDILFRIKIKLGGICSKE
jgi:hypothetical protein